MEKESACSIHPSRLGRWVGVMMMSACLFVTHEQVYAEVNVGENVSAVEVAQEVSNAPEMIQTADKAQVQEDVSEGVESSEQSERTELMDETASSTSEDKAAQSATQVTTQTTSVAAVEEVSTENAKLGGSGRKEQLASSESAPAMTVNAPVRALKQGSATNAYEAMRKEHQVTIKALLAYASKDPSGQFEVAELDEVAAYLETFDRREQIGMLLSSTANPRIFTLSYDDRRLSKGKSYRLMVQVGPRQEQLWTGAPIDIVTSNSRLYADDSLLVVKQQLATGFATDVYSVKTQGDKTVVNTWLSYATRDAQYNRVAANIDELSGYLESTDGRHRIQMTVAATNDPRLFDLSYHPSQLLYNKQYRVFAELSGMTQQLWVSPAIESYSRNQRILNQSNYLVVEAVQSWGIGTDVLDVQANGSQVTIKANLSYGVRNRAYELVAAALEDIQVYLQPLLARPRLEVTVRATQDPRVFELSYHTRYLQPNEQYQVIAKVGDAMEHLWSGNSWFGYTPGAKVYTQNNRLMMQQAMAYGTATQVYGVNAEQGVTAVRSHITFGSRDSEGQLMAALPNLVSAALVPVGAGNRIQVDVVATSDPRVFTLSYRTGSLMKGAQYQLIANVAGQAEHLWTAQSLDYREGNGRLYSENGLVNVKFEEAKAYDVMYDVKLNGITQQIKLSSNRYVATKEYFGQRFNVTQEVMLDGVKQLALMRDGRLFGYVPASAAVRVPHGVKTVYIDAGHGGPETGAYKFGVAEKDLNLNITTQLAKKLRALGYVVYESRVKDIEIPLRERQHEPNALMPDIYVSVHHNAMPDSYNGSAHGILTLYHDHSIEEPGYMSLPYHPESKIIEGKKLANAIQSALVSITGAYNMGARPQNLHVTRTTDVPAVLVELGFMDNVAEHKKLLTYNYQQQLITGLINGITRYFS